MIFLSVLTISIATCICYKIKCRSLEIEIENTAVSLVKVPIKSRELLVKIPVKSKELEIGIYDQYTHCIKTAMKESRENNKPIGIEQAEKTCAKFNKPDDSAVND